MKFILSSGRDLKYYEICILNQGFCANLETLGKVNGKNEFHYKLVKQEELDSLDRHLMRRYGLSIV